LRGGSAYSEMTITSVRPKWSKVMELKTWTEGSTKSVTLVTSPAKEKGTVFLMNDKEIWNYVPSIDRTIKLPPSMMMQNWMGTDLTNDDMVKQSSIVADYDHKILGSEKIDDLMCWKIELTPKKDAAVVWGKIILWIDKEDYMQMKALYYDEDGFLVNKIITSDIKQFGDKKLPSKMEFIPVDKKGHKTIIEYKTWKFGVTIPEEYFTTRYMKRLK
jgi:outer membrane lipoprotein-sorting protein